MRHAQAAAFLLLALLGCAHASTSRVLRVVLTQEPKTLNPLLAANSYEGFVWRLMFEPLVSADPAGHPVPMLVSTVPTLENGGISRDGLTITYHLRPSLRWSDGAPITSNDVRFTWRAVMNPRYAIPSRHGYEDISSLDTSDARTIVVHLRRPLASFVNSFFAESDQPFAILPAHVPFNAVPAVSDGPFTFVRWRHGDRIVLTANPKFFRGSPKLAGIEIMTVPDENTAINVLRTGGADVFLQPSITTFPQLRDLPGVRTVFVGVNGYEGMGFNMRRAPMNDVRFRTAIAYAVDKARMVNVLTYGQEHIASEDLPDWMWANDPSLKPLPYDPAKARALLASAGVHLPVSLVLSTDTGNVTHQREAVLLQSMLHQVGVELSIKTYPAGLLYGPQAAGGILQSANFDLTLLPWYGGLDPDNSAQFSCSGIPPNGWNTQHYCNAEMESLQTLALTHYETSARRAAYHRIERLIARDNPVIVFWWQRQQQAIRTNVRGFTPNPVNESWNAWQWSL